MLEIFTETTDLYVQGEHQKAWEMMSSVDWQTHLMQMSPGPLREKMAGHVLQLSKSSKDTEKILKVVHIVMEFLGSEEQADAWAMCSDFCVAKNMLLESVDAMLQAYGKQAKYEKELFERAGKAYTTFFQTGDAAQMERLFAIMPNLGANTHRKTCIMHILRYSLSKNYEGIFQALLAWIGSDEPPSPLEGWDYIFDACVHLQKLNVLVDVCTEQIKQGFENHKVYATRANCYFRQGIYTSCIADLQRTTMFDENKQLCRSCANILRLAQQKEAEFLRDLGVEPTSPVGVKPFESGTECSICFSSTKLLTIHPCKHRCVCTGCSKKIKECPICRTKASSFSSKTIFKGK